MRACAIILTATWLAVSGACRDTQGPASSSDQNADTYGDLLSLKGAAHPGLQRELARIVDEGSTPELLCRDQIPVEENVAAGLKEIFGKGEAKSLLERSDELFPPDAFRFEPVELAEVIELLGEQASVLAKMRRFVERSQCSFDIDFKAGFEADLSFIDTVRACTRLEAFAAAEALAAEDVDRAVDCMTRMLRLAAWLAAERLPSARLEAAFARTKALGVLEAIAAHPGSDDELYLRLYTIVGDQLNSWTSDAEAWIGDRALGMWVYEMVRAGRLLDVLTPEEVQRLDEEYILLNLAQNVKRSVDEDELYYLQSMRRIIDSCSRPYHARTEIFHAIREELHAIRNSPEFPIVAGRLLLVNIEKGHQTQAQDRANWEAVALALAAACGQQLPPLEFNPVTGNRYEIVRQGGTVAVWNVGSGSRRRDTPIVLRDVTIQDPGPDGADPDGSDAGGVPSRRAKTAR